MGRSWRHVLAGVFLGLMPGVVSAYVHPWFYQTHILSPHRIELEQNSLVELARVNSLRIYATNIETFLTAERDWPPGTPLRDTFIIEVPPRQAGIPPEISGGTIDWLAETVSRMFSKTVDIQDARRISYEGAVSGDEVAQAGVSADMRGAVKLAKVLEPIDREVPYGDVLYYAVPSDLEFARRTGIQHIFALAVQLSSANVGGQYSWATPASLAGHINEVLRQAKAHGSVGVALPLIGAGTTDRSEPDVFRTILAASFDEATNAGSIRAIYIGLFRRTQTGASDLLTKFNFAWLNFYPSREGEAALTDAAWRLTSLIALFTYAGLWHRWRRRSAGDARSAWPMAAAILLLSRGLAEAVLLPVQWSASNNAPNAVTIVIAVVLSAIVGLNLPRIALFEPKDVLKATTEADQ